MTESDLKQVVKEKCGAAARRDADIGRAASCCGSAETASSSCCATGSLPGADPITGDLDDSIQTAELPEAAVPASLASF